MTINRIKKVLPWLPVVALCVAIFVQSCFPALDVGPGFRFEDKVLHMVVYGLLAVLFFRACRMTWADRKSLITMLVVSVTFATLYGISDEVHQFFVPTRQFDVADGIANFTGSLLGAMGYMLVVARRGIGRSFSAK